MGHSIYIKNCGALTPACINEGACNHVVVDRTYLSFNFRDHPNWTVRQAHGKQCHLVSIRLQYAINMLRAEGHTPEIPYGCDGWSANRNVFMMHLVRIKQVVDLYPTAFFLSDQCNELI